MRILAALVVATAALAIPTVAWAYGSEVSAYGCYVNGGQVTRPGGDRDRRPSGLGDADEG